MSEICGCCGPRGAGATTSCVNQPGKIQNMGSLYTGILFFGHSPGALYPVVCKSVYPFPLTYPENCDSMNMLISMRSMLLYAHGWERVTAPGSGREKRSPAASRFTNGAVKCVPERGEQCPPAGPDTGPPSKNQEWNRELTARPLPWQGAVFRCPYRDFYKL